ncbi:MAG: LysM domain-containing protein [Pyrinomonadaceae bacterium]
MEKYSSLIDLANSLGVNGLNVSEGDGFLSIEGEATGAVKQQLWDEYARIDPEYRSGDMVLKIEASDSDSSTTYTVQSGDSLSKIGAKYGISWQSIFEANRDKLDNPDLIHPGQELVIPQSEGESA